MTPENGKILFVDDDPQVLSALRRSVQLRCPTWSVTCAETGSTGLDLLRSNSFDVIVSDLRMPDMDGATLLGLVKDEYPGTLRIALSGEWHRDALVRLMPVAHQLLRKPCEGRAIVDAIEAARRIQSTVSSRAAREAVGKIDRLPSLPKVCYELAAALAVEDVDIRDAVSVIERDISMTTKVLQVASSPYFGARIRPKTLHEAVTHLGLRTLRDLVISIGVFRAFEFAVHFPFSEFSFQRMHSDSLMVGALARNFASPQDADAAFTAGLLRDVGKLVWAFSMPDSFERVLVTRKTTGRPLREVEQEVLGATHAEIGALLLALWGIAWPIVEGVVQHDHALEIESNTFSVSDAVCIAEHVVEEGRLPEFPPGWLESRGAASRVSSWRDLVESRPPSEPALRGGHAP